VALTSSPTRLAGALLFAPDVIEDDRGSFKETSWPLVGEPRVTRKDREAPLLRDSPFAP